MENFNWTSFTKRIAVKASLADLYSAWTTKLGLESWFLEEVNVNGDHYSWKWFLYDDVMLGEFKQTNGTDFIQFTFEGSCLVDVSLEQRGDDVVISLTQHNIPTDDASKQHIRLGCTNGWTFYLANLKSVYEGGLDLRNKDKNLGAMLNN